MKGEPTKIARLAKIFGTEEGEIKEALGSLRENLSGRGIRLMEKDGAFSLATSPESAPFTRALVEEEFDSSLTKAALETMSIVVYRGPVSRADIDYIRGVNSSFILRNLLVRGLVERAANPRDSRSYLYKPSFALLRHLGVQNLEELPDYGNFNEKMEEFVRAAEAEKRSGEPEHDSGEEGGADIAGAANKDENEKRQNNIDIGSGGV